MPHTEAVPLGVRVAGDIEHRPNRASPYRARVRWFDPASKRRRSLSEGKDTLDEAEDWMSGILKAADAGIAPNVATMSLAEYGTTNMDLALRGLELKTLDPYLTGWRRRVVPALGHFPVRMITNGATTAARIGEVSGDRVADIDIDIDTVNWIWTVRRQTTPAPGGLVDKRTKGKRARHVPIVEEIRPLVAERILAAGPNPDARLFTRPRGGRTSTAVQRDATHWDEVVTSLGLEHLRRHDLRHTGLTWFADAGVPAHVLRKIAGHGSLLTTQRYLHPDMSQITGAGAALTAHLNPVRAPLSLAAQPVPGRRR
ncbi:tyrosine-type recombinase/integrase [Streptomyces sp. NPDC059816]|uniref:tyrosine-type recombinase/integrase n=1 Tax=Streptomyces sp. NPDC059816 TaxID=3346960 RepID=UPI00366254AC